MPNLFSLTCPTCGASLHIDGESDLFSCGHCSNKYLLDHKVRELGESARQHLAPVVTYTKAMKQWLKVAEYDLFLHGVANDKEKGQKIFYIEIEYENKTADPVKYRHDQWVVFDSEGHSFEPVKDFTQPQLYTDEKIYLGMTRVLTPGMKLKGWLAFVLPGESTIEYLQFSGGTPVKTVEFRLTG